IRCLGLSYPQIHEAFQDPTLFIETFTRVAEEMIETCGVDVLLAGEGPAGLLLQRNGIHRINEVPIIDGFATTLKTAEMLVQLRRSSGMRVTRNGYFFNRPPEERMEAVRRFYFDGNR